MSKPPFWQPGDKWLPPIVRIKGVETHSKEGQEILQRFSGQIRQFYLGQARNHVLGVAQHTKVTRDFPDARMQYTNMSGQEILDIEVHPKVGVSPQPEPKPEIPEFDWAVVDLEYDASQSWVNIAAVMRIPNIVDLAETPEPKVRGAAKDTFSWASDAWLENDGYPILAYPDWDTPGIATVSGGATHRSSLRIDLRPFRGHVEVVVDLFGYAESYFEDDPDNVLLSERWAAERIQDWLPTHNPSGNNAPLAVSTISYNDKGVQHFPQLSHYIATDNWYWSAGTSSEEPLPTYSGSTDGQWYWNDYWDGSAWRFFPEWGHQLLQQTFSPEIPPGTETYWAPGHLKTTQVQSYRLQRSGAGGLEYSQVPTVADWYELRGVRDFVYYVPFFGTREVLSGVRTATARGRVFPKALIDTWSVHEADSSTFRQWESSTRYPDRWPLSELADDVAIQVQSGSGFPPGHDATDGYGMPLIGSIRCNLIAGTVVFEPA